MSGTDSNTTTVANFLTHIIDKDLAQNKFEGKRWAGRPGNAQVQKEAPLDSAKIRTRFPPEPNGFLHIGHAKSICLNFGLANTYGGQCHLRFDDTNPEKEEQVYVDSIIDIVKWLGFSYEENNQENLFFASDYFEDMYQFAMALIKANLAYVDEQSPDEIRENRGTLTSPGTNSPYRNRSIEESVDLFTRMRAGEFPDGSICVRAKIDMASPNINLRDPVIYRIRHAHHHRTGDAWCVYPMYTFAHPIEDALEGITHSICTLEFEDQRPFYDWLIEHLADLGLLARPLPHQYEFSRLNLKHIVTSKRKLLQLVQNKVVNDWDDPRLPTIAGLRRRGYTPEAIKLFCERIGVSKSDSRIDYSLLEQSLRDVLDPVATRAVAVLDPIKLVITNMPEDYEEICTAPSNPHNPEAGERQFPITRELWIDRADFQEVPQKKYFRLFPGNLVRLKYGYIVHCTGCEKDENGHVTQVNVEYLPDTKSGTPGASSVKVKGTITWVSTKYAKPATVHLYDRLFTDESPDSGDKDFMDYVNPNSVHTVQAWLEPQVDTSVGRHYQFERLGYFVIDSDSTEDNTILNRSVTLRDTWGKK